MQQPNPNEQPQSYIDVLQETMQDEFPLLGEVTSGIIDNPLTLMNAHADDDGVVVPSPLPEMMSEPCRYVIIHVTVEAYCWMFGTLVLNQRASRSA
ncbi:MAG: hypothetical protein IIW42_03440 [Bacteroidaceae bacterium]|nr:hypothetical protein [Bacteroidaceae bacterium]